MRIRAIVFGLLFLVTSSVSADNWPNWRGPTLNGVAPKGTYPVKWSATKNVAWKIKLPGKGTSTPIIWNGQIILTSQEAGKNTTLAVDRSGKTVWKTYTISDSPAPYRKNRIGTQLWGPSGASVWSSPTLDLERGRCFRRRRSQHA